MHKISLISIGLLVYPLCASGQVAPTVTSSAGGSASQSVAAQGSAKPALAIGMTVVETGKTNVWSTPSTSTHAIGVEAQGNQGLVIGGPVSANELTWWQVAFDDDLTGWTFQSGPSYSNGLAPASPAAPTLLFDANPVAIAPGESSTLSWSSTKATSCSGTGFSPSGMSGSVSVSPTVDTMYRVTCTGSGGSTTRSFPVVLKPLRRFSWTKSLPVSFNNPAIVPLGGTEARFLVFMDGSLYAGIGDWMDPQLKNPQTPGAQVLRLDSPTGAWVEDKDFDEVNPSTGKKDYMAIAGLATAHFDHDSGNNPIRPVDVLMAGFWNYSSNGLSVWQKTVTTGSVGGKGTWTKSWLVLPQNDPPGRSPETRSFASYTDSVTHEELAFAGSDPYGIFSGGFNSASNTIAWGANTGSRRGKRRSRDGLRGLRREVLRLDASRHPGPHRRGKSQLA